MLFPNRESILKHFSGLDMDAEGREYLAFNTERYVRLLQSVAEHRNGLDKAEIRLLDVGPSFFTSMLCTAFPQDNILALGIDHASSRGGHWPPALALDGVTFHPYDLRCTPDRGSWLQIPPVDLIVFSEVLEHLYVSPIHVLSFFHALLSPGGILMLTTPNAATLPKRLRFALLGKNPIPLYRENGENPGHFREYSRPELVQLGQAAGLEVLRAEIHNDTYALELEKYDTLKGRFIRLLSDVAPESMRENNYVIYRRPA